MSPMVFGARVPWAAWLGLAILATPVRAGQAQGDGETPYRSKVIGFELARVTHGGQAAVRLGRPVGEMPIDRALRPGDLILKVNGRPVETPGDLDDQHGPTPVDWFASGPEEARKASWIFPPLEVRPVISQPALAKLVAAELEDGKIPFLKPELEEKGDEFRMFLGQVFLGEGAPPAWVEQARVALIRKWLATGMDRDFWERFLGPIEDAIADELKREAAPGDNRAAFLKRVRALYTKASEAYAARTGKRPDRPDPLPPETPDSRPMIPSNTATAEVHRGRSVVLLTRDPGDVVYAMPRTKYLIRSLDERKRPIRLVEFNAYEPGKPYPLIGLYIYKLRHPAGAESDLGGFEARNGDLIRLE